MVTRVGPMMRGPGVAMYAVHKDGRVERDRASFAWTHSGDLIPLPVEPEVLVGMGHMLGWFDRYPWGITAVHEVGNGRVWLVNALCRTGELSEVLIHDPTEKHDGS